VSLTPRQAQHLDHLATVALDALRDQDRLAVQAATAVHDQDDARRNAQAAAQRAQLAELRLFDSIHALVEPGSVDQLPATLPAHLRPARRWQAFLGR
jgi:hypothetical protein